MRVGRWFKVTLWASSKCVYHSGVCMGFFLLVIVIVDEREHFQWYDVVGIYYYSATRVVRCGEITIFMKRDKKRKKNLTCNTDGENDFARELLYHKMRSEDTKAISFARRRAHKTRWPGTSELFQKPKDKYVSYKRARASVFWMDLSAAQTSVRIETDPWNKSRYFWND